MKENKEIYLKSPNIVSDASGVAVYYRRVRRLENRIKYNLNEINKLNKESTEAQFQKVDETFDNNLKELGDLIEIRNNLDDVLKNKINRLDNLYKEVQNTYLNKKIEIINEKMSIVNKDMNDAIEHVKENTNNITGNILFGLISIVLGISLVSAMTTAIKDMDAKYYLPYYVTMGWLAIFVIGFSYLLLRNYDKKAKAIIVVLGCATLVLMAVFYCSFFK